MRILLLVALLAAIACQPSTVAAKPSAVTGVPAGWHAVTNRTNIAVGELSKTVATGFRIALPQDWDELEVDREAVVARYREWAADNPTAAASMSETTYVNGVVTSTKLLAAPTDTSGNGPVEFHIFALWVDAAVTLDRFIGDTTRSYKWTMGATLRSGSRMKIGEREAYVLRMQVPPTAPGKVMTVTAYLLTRDREIWMLEFVGPLDRMDRL